MKETLLSPVSGIVSRILVQNNRKVQVDELILQVEVMKLFYSVTAGLNGTINLIVQEGVFVQEGDILGTIEG